jgi:hypothetical protein
MQICATLSLLFALLLLAGPAVQLVWLVGTSQFAVESAFAVSYAVLALFGLLLYLLARAFSLRQPGWAIVARFFIVATVLAFVTCLGVAALARSLNAVDSSHGGSIVILALGAWGAVLLATSWLLRLFRRSLARGI